MEITATKVDSANAKIEAIATQAMLDERVEKIAKKAARNMKIDGFRKGKVPLTVVKQRYGEQLEQDAERELFQEMMDSAIVELKIAKEDIVGEPNITKYDKKDEKIDIEFKLALKPEINLDAFKECLPDVKEPEVSDKDVEERINTIALSSVQATKIPRKRMLRKDDYALIDFEGFVDGEPLDKGKEDGFLLHIGSNTFIEGFEEQLVGMKPEEEKEIEVTFPADYREESLRSKDVKFKVRLNEIQEKKAAEIDDELAKKILPDEKEATVDMLKEKIKDQLKTEAMSKLYNEDLKPQVLESFAEKINFDLPESVVEQEMDLTFRNSVNQMNPKEIEGLKDDAEKVKELRESFRESAVKSVKVTFIVDALARQEGIDVNEQELLQTIYMESMQMGQDPKQMLENYQKQGLLPAIRLAMIEDKLLTHLLDKKLKGEL